MKTTGKNISTPLTLSQIEERYFAAATIPYSRTKEEVWGEMEVWMSSGHVKTHGLGHVETHGLGHVETHGLGHVETHGRASIVISALENDKTPGWRHVETLGRASLLLAASVIILLGIVGFLHFYTKTINTGNGQHLTATLPDQSTVRLNAQSTLKYHPFWWFVTRNVKFSGEGFFEITKGKKLEVSSSNGKTVVLGTSFNVFSREVEYKVTCFTGKVKVVSPTLDEAILTPDYQAVIGANGVITVVRLAEPQVATGWKENMFNFTSAPLQEVIDEIERQYNISVQTNFDHDFVYTGYFSKDKPVEEVLNLICKPFGLTFVKKSEKQFLIVQQ